MLLSAILLILIEHSLILLFHYQTLSLIDTSNVPYLQTILGEFNKEQDKFVTETKEKKGKQEAAVAPWIGYNEEEAMKTQILALSQVRIQDILVLSQLRMEVYI